MNKDSVSVTHSGVGVTHFFLLLCVPSNLLHVLEALPNHSSTHKLNRLRRRVLRNRGAYSHSKDFRDCDSVSCSLRIRQQFLVGPWTNRTSVRGRGAGGQPESYAPDLI
jgi:hypothetical protein